MTMGVEQPDLLRFLHRWFLPASAVGTLLLRVACHLALPQRQWFLDKYSHTSQQLGMRYVQQTRACPLAGLQRDDEDWKD